MKIGILMLAAGYSRRFGSDKRMATLADGQPLLARSVANASASGFPVGLCLHPGDEALASELAGPGVSAIICPTAAQGMGATLACAVGSIAGWDGVMIALGDMPKVKPATFCKVANTMTRDNISQPTWENKPGHPVGFSQRYFPQLRALEGDAGARHILAANRQALVHVPVHDPGILLDIDRPQDL